MPSILSRAAGVVLHAIWYLDWQTGGNTVLSTDSVSTG
jgi:hypothetical protein